MHSFFTPKQQGNLKQEDNPKWVKEGDFNQIIHNANYFNREVNYIDLKHSKYPRLSLYGFQDGRVSIEFRSPCDELFDECMNKRKGFTNFNLAPYAKYKIGVQREKNTRKLIECIKLINKYHRLGNIFQEVLKYIYDFIVQKQNEKPNWRKKGDFNQINPNPVYFNRTVDYIDLNHSQYPRLSLFGFDDGGISIDFSAPCDKLFDECMNNRTGYTNFNKYPDAKHSIGVRQEKDKEKLQECIELIDSYHPLGNVLTELFNDCDINAIADRTMAESTFGQESNTAKQLMRR